MTATWTIRHILWYRESREAGRQIATQVVWFYAAKPLVWESNMVRDVIETVETTTPILLEEQTGQLKRILPQVFSEGKLILIQLKPKLHNDLGK